MNHALQRLPLDLYEASSRLLRAVLGEVVATEPVTQAQAQKLFENGTRTLAASVHAFENASAFLKVVESGELVESTEKLQDSLEFCEAALQGLRETRESLRFVEHTMTHAAIGAVFRRLSEAQTDRYILDLREAAANVERSEKVTHRLREALEDVIDDRRADEAETADEWVDHATLQKRLSLT